MTELYYDNLITPIGLIEITTNDESLLSIFFIEEAEQLKPVRSNHLSKLTKQQLQEYFAGQRKVFDLPIAPHGTPFQQRVWQALTTLEYGQTCCYADIAQLIDNPKGMRAVGLANGKNPINIVVPCHRVVGKNGSLTGYGGGLNRKAFLLNLEADTLF